MEIVEKVINYWEEYEDRDLEIFFGGEREKIFNSLEVFKRFYRGDDVWIKF